MDSSRSLASGVNVHCGFSHATKKQTRVLVGRMPVSLDLSGADLGKVKRRRKTLGAATGRCVRAMVFNGITRVRSDLICGEVY
jgi:hypothetical protein